ncbi:MAG: DNA polymerase III subunit gamma/tau C-terminal domain-containing protein, partial [Burkholderiaceae bacterium]
QAVPDSVHADVADAAAISRFATALPAEDVQLFYGIAVKGVQELPWSPDPATGFSMTLLRMHAFAPAEAAVSSKPLLKPAADRIAVPVPKSAPRIEAPVVAVPARVAPPPAISPAAPRSEPPPQSTTIIDDWPAFAAQLPLSGFAAQLATQSALIAQEEGKLILRVATKQLADKNNVTKLEAAIAQTTGMRCSVTVEIGELAAGPAAAPATAHQRQEEAKAARQRAAEEAVRNDPHVQELIATFGATIVPGSIKPLD